MQAADVAQISILQVLIPVNEYHEAKERYTKAKERQRELHARVTKLKDRNAPAHAKLESVFCATFSGCILTSCSVSWQLNTRHWKSAARPKRMRPRKSSSR